MLESLTPAQQIIKIVRDELTELMGGGEAKLPVASKPPTVILMAGLNGAGKTTTSGKLAGLLKKQGKRPLLVACDVYRPAAVKQLEIVGEGVGVPVYKIEGETNPVSIAGKSIAECDTGGFPNFEEVLSDTAEPIEKASHICNIITLPGTSERVMLVALPIRGVGGRVYGICGFEVNESVFKSAHAQPSTLPHITCIFSRSDDKEINIKEGLSCGAKNGYFLAPKDSLKIKPLKKGLVALKNEYGAYIGMARNTTLYSENTPYSITVMMPYADYSELETKNTIQLILIILILGFAVLSLSLYFSKRFILPIKKSLDKIKQSEKTYSDESQSGIMEIDDLFAFLAGKDNEYQKIFDEHSEKNESLQSEIERIRTENKRLMKEHKNIIIQDDYDHFCSGLRSLTPKERTIFDLYLEGKTVPEILQIAEVKESTLKYHNGNIYSKLGVSSKKQLLNFAALYAQEK